MVAICTGPAFSTDDAGNLILAGERRKASPSPCALPNANGLYTDPNGGIWTTDQVFLSQFNTHQVNPSTQINASAIVPYGAHTQTYTNSTCWPILAQIFCTFGIWVQMGNNSVMWWETGAAINDTTPPFYVTQSQNFGGVSGVNAFDWFATHAQVVGRIRLEAHSSQQVTVQSRINARNGGATMVSATYNLNAVGYAVT